MSLLSLGVLGTHTRFFSNEFGKSLTYSCASSLRKRRTLSVRLLAPSLYANLRAIVHFSMVFLSIFWYLCSLIRIFVPII